MGDGASCWSGTLTLPEGSRSPCSLNFRTPGWTVGGEGSHRLGEEGVDRFHLHRGWVGIPGAPSFENEIVGSLEKTNLTRK